MPARRLFLALALVSVLLVAGIVLPPLAGIAAAADILLLLLLLVDNRRAAAIPLTASRRWPPMLNQGAPAEVTVTLETGRRRPVTVALRDGLHPGLATRPLRRLLRLRPGEPLVWRYHVEPSRRGDHELLPLTARVLGPWGLAWAQRDLLPPDTCRVYPQVRWSGRVGWLLALAQRRELGQVQTALRGRGTEPYALRDYRPGDPPQSIHWKATARHGHLVTREDALERGGRLVVLLDCGRAMTSLDGDRSKLDHALAATLALTRVAAARGDRVTIAAFSDHPLRVVRVGTGRGDIRNAYGALFDLEASRAEPAYDVAADLAMSVEKRRATVVMFTSVVDLAAAEHLLDSMLRLRRRHEPMLVNLDDPELRELAYGSPDDADEAFAKAASLQILIGNRDLARRLRRGGARLVTAPADRLALETLSAYLETAQIKPHHNRTGARTRLTRQA